MVSLRRNTEMRIFVPAFRLAMAGSRPNGPALGSEMAYASLRRHAPPIRALGGLPGSTVALIALKPIGRFVCGVSLRSMRTALIF